MKRVLIVVGLVCAISLGGFAQIHEVGFMMGTSNFLGDLGKKESKGKFYFNDLEASLFKPAFGAYFRKSFSYRFSMRASMSLGFFEGDDRLADFKEIGDNAWFRNYRNLNFKSHALEIGLMAEFNILKYMPGSMRERWTPYIFGGVALLHFNPKAQYNGHWIKLRPLGTEGQGMPQYPDRKKYSLIQPAIPLGIGFKYNVNKYLAVGFEFGHRVTFTDYLDDVSLTYPSEQEFYSYYGADRAALVSALSRRSVELDPEGKFAHITQGGEVRGNPRGNDHYLFSMISVTYNLTRANQEFRDPFKRKSGMKKMKKYKKAFK